MTSLPEPLEHLIDALHSIPWPDLLWSVIVLFLSISLGFALTAISMRALGRWAARTESRLDDDLLSLLKRPIQWVLILAATSAARPLFVLPERIDDWIRHALLIGVILTAAWLLSRSLVVIERVVEHRLTAQSDNNLQARALQTQIRGFKNIGRFLIALMAVCFVLMTFESVRRFGVSLLASAGVAGVIIGFAAQRSIATLVAGVQIALTQPIRLDDVVIVEGEWGRIEEIRLTYVVVRIWDLRRLVVPITYFIEKPFQNWTRTSAELLGSVPIAVDYSLPIAETRREFKRILDASELWDGKVWSLQVTEASDRVMVIRPLFSAPDSSKQWDLRCEVREKLITWIQDRYPHCLPKIRTDLDPPGQAA